MLLLTPLAANAQYKNTEFGLDVGYWLITKPRVTDSTGQIIANPDQRPLRISNAVRIGGEANFKMDEDHWWFITRVNVAPMWISVSSSDDQASRYYDQAAKDDLGVLLGVQGEIGVRYVVFTDRVRPYIQLGLSYLRIFTFSSLAGTDCGTSAVNCGQTGMGTIVSGTVSDNFLPHPNIGGAHLEVGTELVFHRDMAIHIFADFDQWIIWGAPSNQSLILGVGMNFFT